MMTHADTLHHSPGRGDTAYIIDYEVPTPPPPNTPVLNRVSNCRVGHVIVYKVVLKILSLGIKKNKYVRN